MLIHLSVCPSGKAATLSVAGVWCGASASRCAVPSQYRLLGLGLACESLCAAINGSHGKGSCALWRGVAHSFINLTKPMQRVAVLLFCMNHKQYKNIQHFKAKITCVHYLLSARHRELTTKGASRFISHTTPWRLMQGFVSPIGRVRNPTPQAPTQVLSPALQSPTRVLTLFFFFSSKEHASTTASRRATIVGVLGPWGDGGRRGWLVGGAAATHEEVLLHVVLLVGAVVAEGAREGFLTRVDAHVSLQVVFLVPTVESFPAEMTNGHGLLSLVRGRRRRRRVRGRVGLISHHHWDLPGFALLPLPRLSTIRASSLPLQSAKISEVTQHSHTHTTSIRQLPGLPLLTCTLQLCHHSTLYFMLCFLLCLILTFDTQAI